MKTLSVEVTEEQFLSLQRNQYRNGETLEHTLLRLAGLAPPVPHYIVGVDPNLGVYEQMSARVQDELLRQEDDRLMAAIEEWVLTQEQESPDAKRD